MLGRMRPHPDTCRTMRPAWRFSVLLLLGAAAAGAQPVPAPRPPGSAPVPATAKSSLPQLVVHPDQRYLIQQGGQPFLYLSDTAWELFHRPTASRWRATSSSAPTSDSRVSMPSRWPSWTGSGDPNAYGDLPLDRQRSGPARDHAGIDPANAQQYDYWDHVDYIVDSANRLGLYVALLPTWGRWLGSTDPGDKVFTADNAQSYGEFLGKRYGKKAIIWVLGGDRTREGFEDVWRAMASGIAIGVSGREDYDRRADDVPPGRRPHIIDVVPHRPLARLQHAADGARARQRSRNPGTRSPPTMPACR